jgi:hypothetical protein
MDYGDKLVQLARGTPLMKRLANVATLAFEGFALTWWTGLSVEGHEEYTDSWTVLKAAIRNNVMSINWFKDQVLRMDQMRFRDSSHEHESPRQYLERKFKLLRRLYPVPEAPNAYFYSGEVVRIWAHVPTTWHAVIDPNECRDIAELLKETGESIARLLYSEHFAFNRRRSRKTNSLRECTWSP